MNSPAKPLSVFFYREETPYSLALMRILLPLILLLVVVPRWFHARELFSSDGASAPLALNYGIANLPPEPSGPVAVAMVTLLIVSLVTTCLGWFTRPSLILSFVLYTWLNLLDCLSMMTKYSVIVSHLLLLLSLSQCGTVWSVDARRKSSSGQPPRFPVWPRRLMQILIGLVYLGAAFTKLHTGGFLTSDQLRSWLMTNVNNTNPMGEWLSFYPGIVICMAYIAIVWQIAFVFVVWKPYFRGVALGLGTLFHASTTPLLGLYIFPLVMICSYLCFFSEEDIRRIFSRISALKTKLTAWLAPCLPSRISLASRPREHCPTNLVKSMTGLVWCAVLLASTLAGVAAEHLADPYDRRGPSGIHELQPMDSAAVSRLFSPQQPVRFEDQLLSMDTGTTVLGGVLVDSQSIFRHGETVLIQVTLTPPHSDLWLECNLHDSGDRLLQRCGQIVTRDRLRADWSYELPQSLTPGSYWLVLRSEGKEIARKELMLH